MTGRKGPNVKPCGRADSEASLPDRVTLDEAFRAALRMTEQYVVLEAQPDTGLVLFLEYLRSDPARWDDWRSAVRAALNEEYPRDPRV
jgi:hypothetical protein